MMKDRDIERRADRGVGCMLGQLCGDSLGSLVEFLSPAEIIEHHPDGVRRMTDGGVWDTIAGQPTDDSEMALALARSLARRGTYDVDDVHEAYVEWMHSEPFDIGRSVRAGLEGRPLQDTQANGALMRASPLAIFGAGTDPDQLAAWADRDAALTHPHPVCRQVNVLYVLGLAHAIEHGCDGIGLYDHVRALAGELDVLEVVRDVIEKAGASPPDDYIAHMGWVLTAFQNALWQVVHAPNLEEGVVGSIMPGGDTDTNAAIAGAMLGAVHGAYAIPEAWRGAVLACRPDLDDARVIRPRPRSFWPCDAVELTHELLG
jgi:ADP-ribosyl-[dinitrogen reductase] hydrolase